MHEPEQHTLALETQELTALGFDYGTRRIGIAVGQKLTGTATPLTTLHLKGQVDWEAVDKIVAEWQPDALVVGLPSHIDDTEHEMTRAARGFAKRLKKRYQLPIHLTDERLTSRIAQTLIKQQRSTGSRRRQRKGDVDSLAACIILQSWLMP